MSKNNEQNCRLGAVGGQAVLEGIMMRHKDRCSIAVRKEDGTITVKNDNFVPLRKRYKICNVPIIRGAINMVEMLMLSMRTLNDSAEMLGIEEELESDKKKKQDIAISELKISEIRGRLTDFMAAFKFRGKLYIGDLFDERNRIPEHFKILFCYELLCEISENRADAEIFLSFGKECADIFSEYLTKNGDGELAMKIRAYILDFSDGNKKIEEFRDLIVSQKESLEEKMLSYTVKNIEKFG